MKNRCSSFVRLSKTTLLAMLGPRRFVKDRRYPNQFNFNQLNKISNYSSSLSDKIKDLVKQPSEDEQYSVSGQRAFFEKIKYDWQIISFDPITRLVCVQINDPVRIKTVSVILPNLYS